MRQETKTLTGSVIDQPALDQSTREAMFALMDRAYLVDRSTFFRDLAGKEWAILLRDDAGQVRGFTSLTGHMKEAQFPFALALAALAIHNGASYPPFDPENEGALDGAPRAAVATAVGYRRFEGAALVTAP